MDIDLEHPHGPAREEDRRRNALLASLHDEEYAELAPRLTRVWHDVKTTVYDKDKPFDYVYFPLTAVYSLIAVIDDESGIEVGTIGREGMAGVPAFLGADTSPNRSICQIPGESLQLPVEDLQSVGPGLHALLHRYVQATLVQLSLNAACNRVHTTEERASRWMLMTHDRVDGDEFPLTQEFLSQMLGVRRATVTLAAGALQQAGLIRYTRGQVTVVDRAGLEDVACPCYRIMRGEYERLVGAGQVE